MAKEKRPRRRDLNPKQKAIVEKHREINALRNASPEERAKLTIMKEWGFSEREYEECKEQIEKTMWFMKLVIKYSAVDLWRQFSSKGRRANYLNGRK